MNMNRKATAIVVLTAAMALGAAGCSNSPRRNSATSPAPDRSATTTAGPTVTGPMTPQPTTGESSTGGGSGSGATGGSAGNPPVAGGATTPKECAEDVLLPVVRKAVDNPAEGFTTEKIEVGACRNGYARVFVIPKKTANPIEGDQLFLHYAGGAWSVVDRGASIDCGDENLKPATEAACKALA